ncbi:MAG TPA: DUF4331 family protein [Vicinamibacteria bacterium]|jgi:hypothetical protein|nr:DUF4331 family protein [Vicinamibacteria bacterium]
MRYRRVPWISLAVTLCLLATGATRAADHNDPNAINSIFSDVQVSAADLYDIFGFPADDETGGERVVIALTFASVPRAGAFDTDMLYRVRIYPGPRPAPPLENDQSLEAMLAYFETVKDKYLHAKPAEVRLTVDAAGKASLVFLGFPSGSFEKAIETNTVTTVKSPDGQVLKVYVGGRDDAFFNDLPGFFRSINYAPQFYHVPVSAPKELRELPIPKTLLELEGNTLFNFNPQKPNLGSGVKEDLPPGPYTWNGKGYLKDANGNYRFVYSGKDAQAGRNVNSMILELPLSFVTKTPQIDRLVNTWGESWVLKAAHRIMAIPDDRQRPRGPAWVRHPWVTGGAVIVLGLLLFLVGRPAPAAMRGGHKVIRLAGLALMAGGLAAGVLISRLEQSSDALHGPPDAQLEKYKLVDTDGQAFADAALNEREDDRQVGADNFWLAEHFVTRLAHLGWGFGPSVSALGLKTAFDHGNSPISVHKTYALAAEAFPRVKKMIFQRLNMPDDTWNKHHLKIPLRRTFEVFIPNVCAIDMDTTGTWPFGRRPEDQVATRFLSLFLDMEAELNGKKYNVETLNDPELWAHAPIEPKTPPNPLKNDKPFLTAFPYLAEPW